MAEFEEVINLRTKTTGSESVKSLKQEIREAQAEAVKVSREFGAFSKEATNAAKKVASLRDEMGDFQQRVAALNPDRFQAIAGITQGIAGGITAATGAMALFGSESEDVQKLLVKVQGAIAFSQGIQQILDLKNSFGAVATVIRTQVVTAFSTLKGALISTGIGALVVGLGILISKLIEVGDAADESAEKVKKATDKSMEFISNVQKLNDLDLRKELAIAKQKGASEEEVFDIRRKFYNRRVALINDERAKAEDTAKFDDLLREEQAKAEEFRAERIERIRQQERKRADEDAAAYKKRIDGLIQAEKDFQLAISEATTESEQIEKTAIEAAKKNADELEAVRQGPRVAEQRQLQDWFEAQKVIYNAGGQSIEDLVILRNEKAAAIDEKYYQEQKTKDEAKAAEEIALKKKTDQKIIDEEKAKQDALIQAKQAGFDATSQLLGALASNYATWEKENRALAIGQVLVDEAKAIASTIAGATAAAAAGGPAAPFLVGAYIASGLATVAANFKRVKDILKSYNTANTPSASANTPDFNPINSSSLPGSDEVAGRMTDMRVYVLEGDITKTQGKQQRNRNVSVI